jgi:tetrahydromethanopterin S-methyltransferase subunit G
MENEKYLLVKVNVEEKKLNDILDRLDKAREEINNCYSELRDLGVVNFVSSETATE